MVIKLIWTSVSYLIPQQAATQLFQHLPSRNNFLQLSVKYEHVVKKRLPHSGVNKSSVFTLNTALLENLCRNETESAEQGNISLKQTSFCPSVNWWHARDQMLSFFLFIQKSFRISRVLHEYKWTANHANNANRRGPAPYVDIRWSWAKKAISCSWRLDALKLFYMSLHVCTLPPF